MVADILEAAIRVLGREGARRFTMVRVAEVAGVSVGSLYQYFPNREALFFRLQQAVWGRTVERVAEILNDARLAPIERVHAAVLAVFRADEEEGELRKAMNEAGAPFRDSPQAKAQYERGQEQAVAFFRQVLPNEEPNELAFIADFISTMAAAIAEKVTERKLSPPESERWARATAEMFVCFVTSRRSSREVIHRGGEGD